jgi:murein DD-endopeptidase MepM/ murein hydrolase activator NlpD
MIDEIQPGGQPVRNQAQPPEATETEGGKNRWSALWESIARAGLAEVTLRYGTHILLLAAILLVAWGMQKYYQYTQAPRAASASALTLALPQAEPTTIASQPLEFQAYLAPILKSQPLTSGVSRQAQMHTDVPSRSRLEVIKYTVQAGDNLFAIAAKFGIKPETLLWANQLVLGDNPHNIRPGQELNILPVDGTYHRWSAGDGLNGVAKFFGVKPEDIIDLPANQLDPATIGDWSNPNIQPGTWLVIPGGRREYVSWSAPVIPRENPSVAKVLGEGACGSAVNGLNGLGSFIWPADHHYLSGFDYTPSANHSGIDIDGQTGNPVYAADSGVVVYAGWNNWGYGNVVVINHGNGWQSLYAHLSSFNVTCGQSVERGSAIGTIGETGNATGSHLHFELMYEGSKVNPKDYLP